MDLDRYTDYGDIAEALLAVPVASYLDPKQFDRAIALVFRNAANPLTPTLVQRSPQ